MLDALIQLDNALLDWAGQVRPGVLDGFFRAITWAGSLAVLAPATVVLLLVLYRRGRGAQARLLGWAMVGTVVATHAAKLFFRRPRPHLLPEGIPMPVDWSFPSAHAAQITTFSLCLCLIALRHYPGGRAWLIILPGTILTVLVALSRVCLRVHYPTDVLAGMVLGMVVVALAVRLSHFARSDDAQ
ncbi:MAG: phosphatase PAP2 family protein [Desulfobulbaceae bacterium]